MSQQKNDLRTVLAVIFRAIEPVSEHWVVTGSTGFHLNGVPVRPDDIDIQTTAKGAYEIEEALQYKMELPVAFRQDDKIRSHFRTVLKAGVDVSSFRLGPLPSYSIISFHEENNCACFMSALLDNIEYVEYIGNRTQPGSHLALR